MDVVYQDRDILVCIKPFGIRSTDEPGGLPDLLRHTLNNPSANIRTVHRLDQVVGGLIVLALRQKAASELSRQIRTGQFQKEYTAVVHGHTPDSGRLQDHLQRDASARKTYIVPPGTPRSQEAVLEYTCLGQTTDMSKLRIVLITGRTHQIRCQLSGRGWALIGDQKYGTSRDACPIALWSSRLAFLHPYSGKPMVFSQKPPEIWPWTAFSNLPISRCEQTEI